MRYRGAAYGRRLARRARDRAENTERATSAHKPEAEEVEKFEVEKVENENPSLSREYWEDKERRWRDFASGMRRAMKPVVEKGPVRQDHGQDLEHDDHPPDISDEDENENVDENVRDGESDDAAEKETKALDHPKEPQPYESDADPVRQDQGHVEHYYPPVPDNEIDDDDRGSENDLEGDEDLDSETGMDDETDDESDYRCGECGFLVFCQPSSLIEHEHCRTSNLWKCGKCDERRMTTMELLEHYRANHREYWDSECESEIGLMQ